MTRRIAIIPARGGSKRINHKNIRPFYGKPIIAYSIEATEKSQLFDTIHVSTENDKIAAVAAEYGHPVDFLRPPELADDFTPIMPVLKSVIQTFEQKFKIFDEVMLIMACAPLIGVEDLIGAVKLFEAKPANYSVLSVCKCPVPIARTFNKNLNKSLTPEFPEKVKERSQRSYFANKVLQCPQTSY